MKTCQILVVLLLTLTLPMLAQIDPDENQGLFTDFDEDEALSFSVQDCGAGAIFEVVSNPDGTDNVAKFTTSDCADESFKCDDEFKPIDLTPRSKFYVDVWAPASGAKIAMTLLELANPENAVTVETTTTTSGEWETVEFDFAGSADKVFTSFAIHPDMGGTTAGQIWYVNDITVFRDIVYWDNLIINDFDDNPNYLFMWSCNTSSGEFMVVENPAKEGINTSDNCCWFYTDDCTWEGCAIAERLEYLDFDAFPILALKVYAPYEGAPFMMKIENFDNNADSPIEVTAYSTTAYEWEELTFDFSGAAQDKYQRIAMFPSFNNADEDEWFFDDLRIIDPTHVEDAIQVVDYELAAVNYPNPFNPTTLIEFTVEQATHVMLTVYDVNGRQIKELVNGQMSSGTHQVKFDGADLPSGVYCYRVQTPKKSIYNKMLLIK